MSELRIAPDLALPLDVITQRIGVFGRTGSGKTYTAKRIVEEVIRARLPVVVLDPNGGWWGLRSSADGQGPGLEGVYVLGGEHGHIPLEPTGGADVADLVIEHPGAYVLDLSDFASDAEQDRFATAFAQRLYRGKARKRDPLLLVVDEADAFAPLQGVKGQETMIGAFRTIATKARLRGIGSMWITQRPAVLNASIRAMIELLIVLQVTGKLDREAIIAWLKGKASAEELAAVDATLAKLQTGEMWASSPAWLGLFIRTKASPTSTFDSSKTPEVGEQRVEPTAFAAVDLDALGERMRETAEQARANDPAELRKRIRELEAGATTAPAPEPEIREVEVPVLNGQVEQLATVVAELRTIGKGMMVAGTGLAGVADSITTAIARVSATPRSAPEQKHATPVQASARSFLPAQGPRGEAVPRTRGTGEATTSDPPQQAVAGASPAPTDGTPKLKAGARRMLSALAWFHPRPLSRAQLAMLTDISAISGTVSDYLSALRLNGLIEESGQGVALSPSGLALVAAEVGGAPPTTAQLVERWGAKVKAGARVMLQALVDEHPRAFTRAELAERAGISLISGTTSDYLSALRRAGLLDESDAGIRANESLFLGGRS